MTTIVLLFSLGIILLMLEVVVPGGILGLIGGIAMFVGCGLAFHDFGVVGGGSAIGVALATLAVALFLEFRVLPKTRYGRKFFLEQSVDATSQPLPAESALVVGRIAEAATMMAPSGYVVLDGRRYEATSQSGLIARGTKVRVVAVNNFHLIVAQSQLP